MSSASSTGKPYLLTISILPQKDGVNILQLIRKIAGVLSDSARDPKVVHNFKVTGEPKLQIIVEVFNNTELEKTVVKLLELGPVDIECQPLVHYEKFAQNMEVASDLCKDTPSGLTKDSLYFLEFCIEYQGKPFKDFMALWKKEAETVLDLRCKGLSNIQLYKCLSQRKVLVMMNVPEPAKLDNLTFQLPIMQENGENIQVKCREVQFLDDYLARLQK